MPFLLLLALPAEAGTISRLYDFEPGTKAEADKVDAEFDNIIATVNGNLDSDNFADGAIATADIAASAVIASKIAAGAVTLPKLATGTAVTTWLHDYRKGCGLNFASGGEIFIGTPCELVVDGSKGRITATQSVYTLTGMDTGSIAANKVYYVYGAPNASNSIDFQISLATPTVTTARKSSDSTKRYLGSLRTQFSTTKVSDFVQQRSRYLVFDVASGNGSAIASASMGTLGGSGVTGWFNVPPFSKSVLGNFASYAPTLKSGECQYNAFSTAPGRAFRGVTKIAITDGLTTHLETGPTTEIPVDNGNTLLAVAFSGVGGGDVCVRSTFNAYGWTEPEELY